MIKALLIGGSNYPPKQNALWRVRGDLEKMQAVLEATIARSVPLGSLPDAAASTVISLIDRPRQQTKAAIKEFFAYLTDVDSAIFIFSGYALLEQGKLHFVVCPDAEAIPASVLDDPDNFISAQTVQQAMEASRAKHQVVILDCNFRTTFSGTEEADQPERSVELGQQLGGDRRVILTSSIAVQPIGEPEALQPDHSKEGVWSYLRYLAEGIETGAADLNVDGKVSATELHHYAKQKLVTASPASEAQLLDASAEVANEPIFSVPEPDSATYYRQMLEKHRAEDSEIDEAGAMFLSGRAALKNIQAAFSLAPKTAEMIEREVLRPVREFRQRQQIYYHRFTELTQMQAPPSDRTRQELAQLQRSLNLTRGDVAAISTLPQQQDRLQSNLMRYELVYRAALQRQNPLNQQDRQILAALKQTLQLEDEAVAAIHQRLSGQPEPRDAFTPPIPVDRRQPFPPPPSSPPAAEPSSGNPPKPFYPPANSPPAADPPVGTSPQTEAQTPTQFQSSSSTEPSPKPAMDAPVTEAPLPRVPIVDEEAELATRRRRQRNLLLLAIGTALAVGLATYLYSKKLFPFNATKPIDQAAVQRYNQSGLNKAQSGNNKSAIEDYSKAINQNPNDPPIYLNRGWSYHRTGKLDDAIKDYDTAIALDPKLARAYSNRSHVYYDKNDFRRALEDASNAVKLDPTLAEGYLNLGNAQVATGETSNSIESYNRVLQLTTEKPLLAAAYTNRGNLIARTDVNAAFKDYNAAIQNNPEFAEAYYNRGLGYERTSARASAIQDYEKAARLYLKQNYIPQQQDALKRIRYLRETTLPAQPFNRTNQLR